MKHLVMILTALLVNGLFGGVFATCLGFSPVAGACVLNGAALVGSCLGGSEGMRGGLYMDFWTGETIKAFRTAVRGWLKEIKSYDTLVSDNQTINFVDLGGDPEVLINQSSYPIDVTNLEDANRAIKLDKYQTTATKITEDEAIGLSYDKKATVIERHKEVVEETKYKKALHALAPSENTADTPVLTTTGAANGTRKRMVIADIIALKEKFDKMRVPVQGRVLVLSAEHANDLIREDASFFQRNIDVATGQLKPIYGFKVYEDIDTPTFDATTLKKVAYDAVLDPEKHSVASVAFYAPRMMQATGVTRSYVAEPTPTTQEYLYNLRHYFICLPKKEKQSIAAIVSGIVG